MKVPQKANFIIDKKVSNNSSLKTSAKLYPKIIPRMGIVPKYICDRNLLSNGLFAIPRVNPQILYRINNDNKWVLGTLLFETPIKQVT